ncbi:lantibiotic dehydratase C-terminal domain-containing protein [Nocardia pseudobrasiliensis]|uniref:Lantibiotic biosynthesis dehydratase-like protein n=1 Tax=Nocardia pseudobrasiliensis TaxID=45979 RepID=A0A370I9J2_9NOCA|nr:lantibiotic dehydratase C-terminal domain-containing protein [Nocardia pseudobrasiliensis]RDI67373.1 lantibiotic biosynthesis dehydratase-like protein [Nocardia pseudobrasiliensis]
MSTPASVHIHLPAFDPTLEDTVITEFATRYPHDDWFFLRYWLHGPHLRVRALHPAHLTDLRDAAEKAFATHVCATSGMDQARYEATVGALARAGEGGRSIDPGAVRPPGVVSAQFVPEYDRYGGRERYPAILETFVRSTRIALPTLYNATANTRMNAALHFLLRVLAERTAEFGPAAAHALATAGRQFWQRREAATPPPIPEVLVASAGRTYRALLRDGATDPQFPPESEPAVAISIIHMHNNRLGCGGRPETILFRLAEAVTETEDP